MCGITGIMASGESQQQIRDATMSLAHAVVSLEQVLPLRDVDSLSLCLEALREVLDPLPGYGAVSPEHRELFEILGKSSQRLKQVASIVEEKTRQALAFDQREAWNQVGQITRDLSWRIEEDFLGSQQELLRIFPMPQSEAERRALPSYWSIACTLRNLQRLEIRGRDSSGLSILVHFASSESIERYLNSLHEAGYWPQWEHRCDTEGMISQAICGADQLLETASLSFLYKEASEVGSIGQNISALREQIYNDELLRLALFQPGASASPLAHTRWASNGIINVVNAHPQGCDNLGDKASETRLFAVLNGDIDNMPELLKQYRQRTGREMPQGVTTDAKIIPLLVEEAYQQCGDMREAFRQSLNAFRGSFAIALHHLDEPERVWLGIGGSGQALYVGLAETATFFASELYGIVEGTRRFIKLDGECERVPGDPSTCGQLLELHRSQIGETLPFSAWSFDGVAIPESSWKEQSAQITTRDINIAGYPHFFLKEICESVDSVRNTTHGRFFLDDGATFQLDEATVPQSILEALRKGQIKHVYCIGQGTAAIAAMGVASALKDSLPPEIGITATKASELSGHMLTDEMSDTLVVAVSQSGTTTDTNRTVELLRQRGAHILAILNRRNSDLAFKAHGVLYTSNGRDVEMSVASTKAFYSQVTAGVLLSLYLGYESGYLSKEEIKGPLQELQSLPDLMGQVLAMGEQIKAAAQRVALSRRYWAVVGSGCNQIAAHEIRIKLSELCYKSMSCDTIEDKKHIDLSAEPLMLVCAAGLDEANLSDTVKEVAIFKAHSSIPIVITSRGAECFRPYAEVVFEIPDVSARLAPVLTTIVGHLFGYYAACTIDEQAGFLRSLRGSLVSSFEKGIEQNTSETIVDKLQDLQNWLLQTSTNAALEVTSAVQLALFSQRLISTLNNSVAMTGRQADDIDDSIDELLSHISTSIRELSRPIDAIKHQAKTVTVGISRSMPTLSGSIRDIFDRFQLNAGDVTRRNIAYLSAVEPLLDSVSGATLYRVAQLESNGAPGPQSRICKEASSGSASLIPSRTSVDATLKGSKWLALKNDDVIVGIGRRDGRHIAIVPIPSNHGSDARIALLHLSYNENAGLSERQHLLRHRGAFYDQLRAATTELQLTWDDNFLTKVPVETLFDDTPDRFLMALTGHWSDVERAQALQREAQSMASWTAWPAHPITKSGTNHTLPQ